MPSGPVSATGSGASSSLGAVSRVHDPLTEHGRASVARHLRVRVGAGVCVVSAWAAEDSPAAEQLPLVLGTREPRN